MPLDSVGAVIPSEARSFSSLLSLLCSAGLQPGFLAECRIRLFCLGSSIAQLLLRPNVLDFIDTAFGTERLDVEIGEVRVESQSRLVGKKLGDGSIRLQADAIILGVKPAQGALLFNPAPDARIRASDTLIVIGGDTQLKKLETLASAAV
jgi:Trk K+ transport system NAD-binding subunit